MSLRTSDPDLAELRHKEIENCVKADMSKSEIIDRLKWIPIREKRRLKGMNLDPVPVKRLTIGEFRPYAVQYWEDHDRRSIKGFHDRCLGVVADYFSSKPMSEITPEDIVAFQKWRKNEGVKNATVNRELSVLRKAYKIYNAKAIKLGVPKIPNPVLAEEVEFLPEPKGRIRFLENEGVEGLIGACPLWLKPLIAILTDTGVRISELLGLQWDNVDFSRNAIILELTKTNEVREVPMTKRVKSILWERWQGQKLGKHVFLTRTGNRLSYFNVRRAFHVARIRAGISNLRIHDLRHTFASNFLMSGGDIYTLGQLLGHRSTSTTAIYTHLATEFKQKAIARFETHMGGEHRGGVEGSSFTIRSRLPK